MFIAGGTFLKFTSPRQWGFTAIVAAVCLVLAASAGAVAPSVVYNATTSTLPPNVVSLGFEATSTSEFGDHVTLAGTDRLLSGVTVTMSDWALYSDYSTDARYAGNSATWSHPITVNIYSNHLGANGAPDTLLATTTQLVTIPWRPAADPTCAGGTAWRASDSQCYNGIAFNATFDLSSSDVTLPNDVIVGVAYNTADYGATPIHAAGPYNSLNVGVPTSQPVTVGSDVSVDRVFANSTWADFYTDHGAAGVGTFREDTGWAPTGTVALKITASSPLVGPPTSKDQCKNGGWKAFNNPSFNNQGACEKYVKSHKHENGDDDNDQHGDH